MSWVRCAEVAGTSVLTCVVEFDSHPSREIWIDASFKATFFQWYVGIAGMPGQATLTLLNGREKVKFVLRTLEGWKERWLMVSDNCNDLESFTNVREFTAPGMCPVYGLSVDANVWASRSRWESLQ